MSRSSDEHVGNAYTRWAVKPAEHPASRKGLILFALCLAALIINIDVTIVNVTLPSLVRELDATTTDLQWVVDAYTLVFAALILAAGSLSDRLGRKEVLLAGLGVFGAASLAGAFGQNPGQLIAARAVMGLGAAAIFPSTLSLIANVFTDRSERAKAIGLWGATTGVGVAAGPIIGGWLLGQFWWGSVFLFMAPVAAVIAAVIASVLPTRRLHVPDYAVLPVHTGLQRVRDRTADTARGYVHRGGGSCGHKARRQDRQQGGRRHRPCDVRAGAVVDLHGIGL